MVRAHPESPHPATLLAAPVSRAEPAPVPGPSATTPSAAARAPIAATPAPARLPDSANAKRAAKQKPAVTREPDPSLVVAVTRGVEQSTKAKLDSAGKPPVDIRPIFRKP